jgi:hypothetical protein
MNFTYPQNLWISYPHYPHPVDNLLGIFPHLDLSTISVDNLSTLSTFYPQSQKMPGELSTISVDKQPELSTWGGSSAEIERCF